MGGLPTSIVFACDRNSVRSPIAAALMKHLLGYRIHVDSVGALPSESEADPFAIVVMAELGLDIAGHQPKTFEELDDLAIDLIVTFTPRAHHRALELTRTIACDVEYWPLPDATLVEGNREARLAAYRQLRDDIYGRLLDRFPGDGAALD